MGIVIEILTEAIEVALERGSAVLELTDFMDAYSARTLQTTDQNPFHADAWDSIDTTLLRPKSEEDSDPIDEPKKRRN
jgi:hypothetical protein